LWHIHYGKGKDAMNRNLAWLLAPLLLASVHLTGAQQPKRVYRIGFLSAGSASSNAPRMEAFRHGLRELGYIEVKNVLIEYRHMNGDQNLIPSLAAELVQLNVDVLVSGVYPTILAAKKATHTIPIVMVITQDPVKTGLVNSLARPSGNITGVVSLARYLSGKRLAFSDSASVTDAESLPCVALSCLRADKMIK
jgi:putative ABC transport system substrate-binding protein